MAILLANHEANGIGSDVDRRKSQGSGAMVDSGVDLGADLGIDFIFIPPKCERARFGR